jgi:hypothetical protein
MSEFEAEIIEQEVLDEDTGEATTQIYSWLYNNKWLLCSAPFLIPMFLFNLVYFLYFN